MILGLVAGAIAFAQTGAPPAGALVNAPDSAAPAGAIVKDLQGTLTVQIGNNPPQAYKPGTAIPVGAIVRTGAKSSVTLVFPDGQICALGENSTFRMASYSYDPRDLSKGEISLNLIEGSLRMVMGEIALANPDAVRVQVGVATIGVDASSAPHTDASVVVQGGPVAITVERGNVVAFPPSGGPLSIFAGQGLIFGQDGAVFRGTTAQILQQLGTLPQGQQMQQQFATLEGMSQNIALTVIILSNPVSAQRLLAALENLPPPGDTLELPPPVLSSANTPATGAGGGGPPCSASCN